MAEKITGFNDITGAHINVLLRAVVDLTDNGDAQLSILTFALVAACRGLAVPEETLHRKIAEAFAQPMRLIPLPPHPESDQHG